MNELIEAVNNQEYLAGKGVQIVMILDDVSFHNKQ